MNDLLQNTAQAGLQTRRRATLLAAAAGLTLLLSGCAAMRNLSVEVSSFGDWPQARKPGTYAFERLPSQQARDTEMQLLEGATKGALAKAGFTPVPAGAEPDVLVQVGNRVGRADTSAWNDPLWWRGGFGTFRHNPWAGPRWSLGLQFEAGRYEHQVAVLLRDRSSGKPIFEARASRESSTELTSKETLALMFEASLMDFPRLGVNPRTVSLPLP
jgi:Domain of unknown function (DUF4136)